jgi:hypothetical protein
MASGGTAPPGKDRSLTAASRAYTAAIDDLARQAGLAACPCELDDVEAPVVGDIVTSRQRAP